MQAIIYSFSYLASLSILLPLLIGGVYFKKSPSSLKFFYIYIFSSTICEITLIYLSKQSVSNHFIFNTYALIEFIFICAFLSYINIRKKYSYILAGTFAFIWAITIIKEGISILNSKLFILKSISISVLSFISLIKYFQQIGYTKLTQQPIFFLICGVAFYSVSSLSIYGLSDYLILYPKYNNIFIVGNNIINLTTNIIYTYAYLCPLLFKTSN